MAYGLTQHSGGRLETESAPGQGTTIRILFRVIAPDTAAPEARPLPDAHRILQVSRSERRPAILVIKDDANIAAFARNALEETGYRLVTAQTAERALTLFLQAREHDGSRFILVFTDAVMPGAMNGVALTKEIRARDPGGPVLLTIKCNDQMSLDGPQSGGLGVLRKSFRRDEVRYRHIPYLLCLFIDVDGVDTRVHRLLSWFRSHEARRCPTTRCCSRTSSSTSPSATGS